MSRADAGPADAVDGDRILADARSLAFPRYPGTKGDARAIEWLAGRLRDTGLEVEVESFTYNLRPAMLALRTLLGGSATALAAASLLAARAPLLAALLLGATLASASALLLWSPLLGRLYEAGRERGPTRTANVVARRPAKGAPRRTLIVMAHHDSKSQSLRMPLRLALTLGAPLGAAALALPLATSLWSGEPMAARWPVTAGLAAAAALAVLATLTSGNESPGAVDNAGSVGVLLELARRLTVRAAADCELVFLSPGAEEDHMIGARRWLDRHRHELEGRSVLALNIDGAGIPGRVALLERYGLWRAFSPRLSRLARAAAGELGIRVRGVLLPPALGVDAIPFAQQGIDTITLASGSLGRAALAVHSAGDRAENLDRAALVEVARLTLAMALRLVGPAESADGEE